MPRKPKPERGSAEILAPIPADILDQIVRDGPLTAAEVETATRRLKKALIERALGAELSHHLGYAPGTAKPELTTNHRNETSGRRSSPTTGRCRSWCRAIGRARSSRSSLANMSGGSPASTTKSSRCTRGLTLREIQAFLNEMYAVDVPPDLISAVTDAVVANVTAW